MNANEKLGKYIEHLMKKLESQLISSGKIKGRKLSRNYMAKEVLGVSGTWFSGVINGENEPSDELLIKIANYFEIDERSLFVIAERIHPKDLSEFKDSYLKKYSKIIDGN